MNARKLIIFFILFVFLVFPKNNILAQSLADVNVNDISIRTVPEIPEANQEVEITLSSFLVNLDNAKIDWSLDGKIIRTGVGIKKFLITTKGISEKQTVTAVIFDLSSGKRFEKNLIIEPSSIDLLWEVQDGYTNNFYKGKVLPVRESMIKITAIPNKKNQTTASQKNLIFNWKRNYDNIPDSSGFGKQSFSFRNNYLKEVEVINVLARDGSSSYVSSKTADLILYNPIILFYQKTDGLGVNFWNALNNDFAIGTGDFSIIAEPFYITPREKNDSKLRYTWKVNGNSIVTPEYKSYLTIRGDGGSGTSNIQLEINNISRIFQNVSRNINVKVFGN